MKSPRLILPLGLAVLFVLLGWWFGPKAFPLANVDFAVTRSDAAATMRHVVESLGHPLDGYSSATTFGDDSEAKDFVELEYGVRKLEERAREGMAIWYWAGRWFKPGQHEEFSAWVDVRGNLVGFEETLKEEEARTSLSRDEALGLAEEFLTRYAAQHAAGRRKLVSESVEKQPNREDHSFTWEQENLRLGEAPYRLHVTIHGDRVGTYGEGLKVPEQWTRGYERKRNVNELCQNLANYAAMVLLVGVLVLFVRAIMLHRIRWRDAMPRGWFLVFAAVAALVAINNIPGIVFSYETTEEWPAFVTGEIFDIIFSILAAPVGMWLLFLITDAVQTEFLPSHAPLRHVLGRHALRDPQVVRAMGIGILAAIGGYAYVSVFYVIGARFGVWAPVDVDHSKVLSGLLPWIEPMSVGLDAAFMEEFLFRVIAILLLTRLLRVRWLAVVIAAVVWAFLHSSYPQMPGYIRGVELTIEGIIWGVLFLRYGVVCTLTAHYLYNCWLGSLIVIQSASWMDRLGAVAVSAWPVVFFLWAVWAARHGPHPIPEAAVVPPPLPPEPVRRMEFPPVRISRCQATIGAGIAAVLLGIMIFVPLAQRRVLALGAHDLSREQILARADAILREKGVDPGQYLRTISSSAGSLPSVRYMLQYGSLDDLTSFFSNHWPDLVWNIRYFQILEKEEYRLRLDQHGRLVRYAHQILAEATGASLDQDAALTLARETLRDGHGVDVADHKLITINPTKQEHRMDYSVVFEKDNLGWGEAALRTSLALKGDEPGYFSQWVKVPEAWLREQRKSGWREVLTNQAKTITALAVTAVGGVFLVFLIRRREIPWRFAFCLALFPLALRVIDTLNGLPGFYLPYSTTATLPNFLTSRITGMAGRLVWEYLGAVFLVAIAFGIARWAFGAHWQDLIRWPKKRADRRAFLGNTAAIVVFSVILLRFDGYLRNLYVGHALPTWAASFSQFAVGDAFPWLNALTSTLASAFRSTLSLMFGAGVFALAQRRWPRAAWIALPFFPLVSALGQDEWQDFFYTLLRGELSLALAVFLVVGLWRFNLPAIFLSYAGSMLVGWITLIWAKGGPAYRGEIFPLIACVGIFLFAVVIAHKKSGDAG